MDFTLDKAIFLFMLLAYLSHVNCEECECGVNCDHFKGQIIDKECYYIADINRNHGKQFMFTNAEHERMIIDDVIKKPADRNLVKFSTTDSYVLRFFNNPCAITNNCSKTVYHSNCECKTNVAETVWNHIKNAYTSHRELILGIALIILFILIITILKCCCM